MGELSRVSAKVMCKPVSQSIWGMNGEDRPRVPHYHLVFFSFSELVNFGRGE